MITVKVNETLLKDAERLLEDVKGGYPRAVYQALKRTLTTGRARIARIIGEVVNLRIGDIKKTITQTNPSPKMLKGSLEVTRKPVPLINYLSNKQKSAKGMGPVKVKVRRNAPAEVIPKSFINAAHSPYLGVFQRLGIKRVLKTGKRAGRVGQVISRMYGPTAVGVFANSKAGDAKTLADSEALDLSKDFEKNLNSQIDRFLK